MSREEQVKICSICLHRKMDISKGLVCNLTQEWANFHNQCASLSLDEAEFKRLEAVYEKIQNPQKSKGFWGSWKSALVLSVLGFFRAAMNGFESGFGILFLVLGLGWLIIAISMNKD